MFQMYVSPGSKKIACALIKDQEDSQFFLLSIYCFFANKMEHYEKQAGNQIQCVIGISKNNQYSLDQVVLLEGIYHFTYFVVKKTGSLKSSHTDTYLPHTSMQPQFSV